MSPTRLPIARLETVTISDKTYQPLLDYQVPPDAKKTILEELSLTADPNAQYRLVIGDAKGGEQFRDKTLSANLTWPWRKDNVLGPGQKLSLFIRSSTGTSITVSAAFTAEEEYD